jgi:glycosyltransferase involved in cell wall biosynthesis
VSTARKLLFVVARGRLDPSGIKRAYDLLPCFQSLGYETVIVSHDWESLWKARMKSDLGSEAHRRALWMLNAARLTPAMIHLRSAWTTVRFTRRVRDADAVIVIKSFLDDEWRSVLRANARRVIYDFDDAVWMNDERGFVEMMGLSDAVVAGNGFLAAHASKFHQRVSVIPTGVRLDRYETRSGRRKPDDRCVIGWVGSPSTVGYLEMLVSPLAALGEELNITLRVVGAGASALPQFHNVKVESHPSIPYDPVRFVPGFDIGVMPLADTDWERGKCGAKLLEYMAAAVPAISSAVGENVRIVKEGVTGMLARTEQEWVSALRRLAGDSDLRQRMGEAARENVRRNYGSEVIASMWRERIADLN